MNKDKRPKPGNLGNKRKKPVSVEDKPRPSFGNQRPIEQIFNEFFQPTTSQTKPDLNTNKRPKPVEDKPVLNFPEPSVGNQKPIEHNFDEFFQPSTQQTQVNVNKNKSPESAPLLNFPKPTSQFDNQKPIEHNFDEFFQPTTPQTQIDVNKDKTPKPEQSQSPDKKETKKPSDLDQKIDSTKPKIPPKIPLNLNKTQFSPDNIFFEDEDEDEKTTSLSPIEILSTTPAIYSTTHKRIIPGLPSPEDDGDYNEDDKISNSALLSLVG